MVAVFPDFSASEESVVALPSVESGTITEEKSDEVSVVLSSIEGDASDSKDSSNVLPMIGGDSSVNDVTSSTGGEVGNSNSSSLILEIPGSASVEVPAVQTNHNNLQMMIEQANILYKEGKVAEAQALFEKIGSMNKANVDAAVLVKK